VNSDSDAINQLVHSKRWNVNETVAEKLLELYPNDPTLGEPYGWGNRTWPQFGLQYKRYQSIATDLTMYAPRRLLAQSMSEHIDHVYSYRWDAPKFNNTPETIGVNHFSEVSTMLSVRSEKDCRIDLRTDTLRLWKPRTAAYPIGQQLGKHCIVQACHAHVDIFRVRSRS